MKKNIHGICAHLDQVDQILSRHAGIIKAVAGAGGYLNRMGHLAYYLIYFLSVKKSGVTLNELERIVTKVLWVNEYGKTLQVLTAEDAESYFDSYVDAIKAIPKDDSKSIYDRPGISVKISAIIEFSL